MVDGLGEVVARGQPIGAHGETAAPGRQREREVGVHHLVGHPDLRIRLRTRPSPVSLHEVDPRAPGQRPIGVEARDRHPREARDVDHRPDSSHLCVAAQAQREIAVLSVERLCSLHQTRGLRGPQIDALPLADDDGAGVWTVDRDDRDPYVIQPRHVCDPGDAQGPRVLGDPRHRVARGDQSVGALPVALVRQPPGFFMLARFNR